MPAHPSRRTVVAAAVSLPAAAAAGCSLGTPEESPQAAARGDADPDVALLDEVAGGTQAMVALYEETLRRHGGLRRDLEPLLTAHRAHAEALGEAAPPTRGPAGPNSGPGAGAGSRAQQARPDVPGRAGAALRELRAAERRAADDLHVATGRADSGAFARLLASMAAASAQHARVLVEVDL
jgi:hypothetical protein